MSLKINLEDRKDILKTALILENTTSIFLAELLGIKNYKESKSFGNTSGNLTFSQKISLLIDIGALSETEKSKFIIFMEIRNQFMHNLNADTYELCFSFLNGREKSILKTYPQDKSLKKEEQLKRATFDLSSDIVVITSKIFNKIKEKFENESKVKLLEKSKEISIKTIQKIEEFLNNYIEEKIQKEQNISAKELKGLGTIVRKLYFGVWEKDLKIE